MVAVSLSRSGLAPAGSGGAPRDGGWRRVRGRHCGGRVTAGAARSRCGRAIGVDVDVRHASVSASVVVVDGCYGSADVFTGMRGQRHGAGDGFLASNGGRQLARASRGRNVGAGVCQR